MPSHPDHSLSPSGKATRWKAIAKSSEKRAIDVYFSGKCAVLRAFGVIDFPVPPNHNLRTTSSHSVRHYYESGLTTFLPIARPRSPSVLTWISRSRFWISASDPSLSKGARLRM
jgi:hypothetical protein